MRPAPKVTTSDDDESDDEDDLAFDDDEPDDVERLQKRAAFIALVCKLSGVPVSEYEAWLDSMSPEYFGHYIESILDKSTVKLLMRVL